MRFVFSSLFLMVVLGSGASQQPETVFGAWGTLGYGIGSMGNNEGIAPYIGGNVSFNRIKVRTDGKPDNTAMVAALRFIPVTVIGDENHSGMRLRGTDVLIGASFGQSVQFRLLAGLGVTTDCNPKQVVPPGGMIPEWVYDYFKTVDIPVEAGLFLTSPHIGLGFSGFFSLNFGHQFAGVNVRLEFGKIR